jgi:hypothetical protein
MTPLFEYFEDKPPLLSGQRSLLRALVAPDQEALISLESWVQQIDFDRLDPASFRLVPALFRRWGNDPLLERHRGRIKGIYRYFLFRSNLVAGAARPVLAALAKAEIRAVAIKGLAIGLRYYESLALRPMADIDVLVERQNVAAAEAILEGLGWRYRYDVETKEKYTHSYDYIDDAKNGFDLHWHALVESAWQGADRALWTRVVSIDWQGQPLLVPSREDLTLIAMVSAMREPGSTHCVWIHDVCAMILDSPDFDWSIVWAEAIRRKVSAQVFSALQLLADVAPEIVPTNRVHEFLAANDEFASQQLRAVVSERRTYALTPDGKRRAREQAQRRTRGWIGRLLPGQVDLAHSSAAPGHMRLRQATPGGGIGLYLHKADAPILGALFEISDERSLWRSLRAMEQEGELELPQGSLKPRQQTNAAHSATIKVFKPSRLHLSPGGLAELTLLVTNTSQEAWTTQEGDRSLYGVTYHLHNEAGELIEWERPRCYLMTPRPETLAFIAPGQRVACTLTVKAPETSGKFVLRLDVVRETVTWFSNAGSKFPSIELEVE